ncbi:MAG TPA: hypothetical protein H9871_05475, partial [Candidatus Nesterenkonia stercoripullorum]|nr:hypothetical protein [Candidatus Nesterenkonia stercoripullorum]
MSFSQGFGSSNPFSGGLFGSGSGKSGPGQNDDDSGSGGGGDTPRAERSGPRRPSALVLTIIIIAVLIAAFVAFAGLYAEV